MTDNTNNCKAEKTGRCSFDCVECPYERIKIIDSNNKAFTFREFYLKIIRKT